MKKANLLVISTLILLIILVGCGVNETTNTSTNTSNKKTSNTETDTNMTKEQNNNSQPKEVILDNKQKVNLNTFFSNFTEVHLSNFQNGTIDDKELLRFGAKHSVKNKNTEIDSSGYGEQISPHKVTKVQVSDSIKKYFNKEIDFDKFKSTKFEGIEYKDGCYLTYPADREFLDFAIINKLIDDGNGYYTAYVNVYDPYDELLDLKDTTINIDEPYKSADLDKKLTNVSYHITAKIHKENDGRYILVEYLSDKQ